MACPGLATHTVPGLCALCLLSAAPSSGNLHKPAKPQPPQTTCPGLPQPPVQAHPHLMHTAEAVFDLAVPHGAPRTCHQHTGRALCTVVAERRILQKKKSRKRQNRIPNKPPAQPCPSTQCRPHHSCCPQNRLLNLTLQCLIACQGLATHTLAWLCALWLLSGASLTEKLQKMAKPQPP